MNITINGENLKLARELDVEVGRNHDNSVASALSQYLSTAQTETSFAVAVNGDFVSKESYTTTILNNNDSIDVLFPIVGG